MRFTVVPGLAECKAKIDPELTRDVVPRAGLYRAESSDAREMAVVQHPARKAVRCCTKWCPRALDVFQRCPAVAIGPKHSASDVNDTAAAVRKVNRALSAWRNRGVM